MDLLYAVCDELEPGAHQSEATRSGNDVKTKVTERVSSDGGYIDRHFNNNCKVKTYYIVVTKRSGDIR
jgi:hypothetical protein